MERRLISILFTSLTMIVVILTGNISTEAKSIKDYETEINELDNEKNAVKQKQNKLSSDKDNVKGKQEVNKEEQEEVTKELEAINEKLTKTEGEITKKEAEIQATETEISALNEEITKLIEEIKDLEDRIMKREKLLIERLRSIQEAGGDVSYMAVILGSQNFNDLLTRSSAVNSIMDQDKKIMEEQRRDQLALLEKQTEVEEKKENLEKKHAKQETQKDKLVDLQQKLDKQNKQKEKIKKKLKKEYKELEAYSLTIEEENEILEEQAIALEKAKELANNEKSQLEEEKRKEREAEIARQEALAAQEKSKKVSSGSNKGGGSGSSANGNSSSGGDTTQQSPIEVSGSSLFNWPTSNKSVSSPFGPRWGRNHNGIDISASRGTPAYAAADGVVSRAVSGCVEGNKSCGSGYGNHLIVVHQLKGKTYATVYAHLSSLSVSQGQAVKAGEHIGGIGNTGHSYGAHLHFEVHPGGYQNPANPLNYLN